MGSEDVTSSDHCLSPEYKGADCDPTAGGSSGEAEKEEPAKDEAEKEEPAKEEAEKKEPAKDEAEKKEPAKDEAEKKEPAKDIEKNDEPASRTPKLRGGKAKADQDKGAPERLPRQEAAPATKKKSDKCVRIDGRKILGCPDIKFYGHNYYGYEMDDVIEAFDTLHTRILPLAKTFLTNIPEGCIPSLKTEMCGVFFPSCSGDCQERKACTSSCNNMRLVGGPLVSQLDMIKPGGMLSGVVKSQFPKEKIYKIVQTIISNLSCDGDNLDSDEKQCAKVSSSSTSCSAEMAEAKSTKPTAIRLFPTQEPVKRVVKGKAERLTRRL